MYNENPDSVRKLGNKRYLSGGYSLPGIAVEVLRMTLGGIRWIRTIK